MSVGRNELCPCGSGKKYKKCCGVVTPIDELRGLREQRLRKDYTTWIERLRRFVAANATDADVRKARAQFAREVGLPEETLLSPEWAAHFYNWYVFDRVFGQDRFLDRFLATEGRKMEAELQQGFRALTFGLHVLEEIEAEQVTVRDLTSGQQRTVIDVKGVNLEPGQVVAGRLLSLGQRHLLFSGSMIVSASYQQELAQITQKAPGSFTLDVYRIVLQSGGAAQQKPAANDLVQRIYSQQATPAEIRKRLEAHPSFVLKKQDVNNEIWVYSSAKQEYLLAALGNTLLELHEVAGEVHMEDGKLVIESFPAEADEMAAALHITEPVEENVIKTLTSTNARLSKGTVFITSEPELSPKLLQWAVQTYFAEKWLATEQPELGGLEPILVAASENEEFKQQLEQLVAKQEEEKQVGQGAGRYMRLDLLRPRLALPNKQLHVGNLLTRPLIEGLPESVYTVQPRQLADITAFVKEMTDGKSEATVKKYDEVMNLFRTFVRSAFGPRFVWEHLRPEELAYFLLHDVLQRTDSASKTLASNLLSVLTAFFKWLDKHHQTDQVAVMQPLLGELKDTLPESYRMRQQLQKEALANLYDASNKPTEVVEETVVLQFSQNTGWMVKRSNGENMLLAIDGTGLDELAANWSISGVFGRDAEGKWLLYSTPELYPPVVSSLLGAEISVLV
ncbi:MAG: YecA family protein [Clostridia bacterium]